MIREKKDGKKEKEHASEVQKRRFEKGLAGFAGAVKRWSKKAGESISNSKDFPSRIKKPSRKPEPKTDESTT
tara:strand:- start:9 stop:224 length:216 start_codon:yes stop_codon:yes gene_type:complete